MGHIVNGPTMATTVSREYSVKIILTIGEKLYLNEEIADFHFVFELNDGQYERIPAHKNFLATASDVFQTMFNGTWKENNEVEIVDAPAVAFKEFLQFFYLGRVKLTSDNVAKVMYLADKYNVTECLMLCTKFLRRTITDENVCRAYGLSILHEQDDLKRLCELMIAKNTKEIILSKNFLECDKKALGHILKMDSLSCSEDDVFQACMAWLKYVSGEENLTKEIVEHHLGELFYEIRYKSMSIEMFAVLDASYGSLFKMEEYREIVQLITLKNSQLKQFNRKARKHFEMIKVDKKDRIICDRAIANTYSWRPYFIKNTETTRFSINEPLLLAEFCCESVSVSEDTSNVYFYTEEDLPSELTIVQVSATEGKEEVVLHNSKESLKTKNITYISLAKPILIQAGIMYEIRLKQTPPDGCCTGIQMKTTINIDPDIVVQFHDDPIPDNDGVARGLVGGLTFNRI